MKSLFTPEEFAAAKSQTKLPCECKHCGTIFFINKHRIQQALNPNNNKTTSDYCSIKCIGYATNKHQKVICLQCGNSFLKQANQIKQSPTHFCSRSCAITYHNTHKTTGTRRSKLEKYLEERLPILYQRLEFHFNRKDAINSELDIYIPSLKLAFELNGIFHYEPIYGVEKLSQIENNDHRKFQACVEHGIEMCIVDASLLTYFKKERADKYLKIVTDIIDAKLCAQGQT